MVGNGTLVDSRDAIGNATGIRQFLNQLFDALCALGNLLNQFHVTGREPFCALYREHILHALYVLDELRLVVGRDRDDMVHREVTHDTGLNLNRLHVSLPFHLVSRLQFLAVHDLRGLEHADGRLIEVVLDNLRARFLHIKTPATGFHHPGLTVAIAIETHRLTGLDILAQHIEDGRNLIVTCSNLRIYTLLETLQGFCHRRVEGNHRRGTVGRRARGTELKAITREGKR